MSRRVAWLVDFVIIPALLAWLAFEPHCFDGAIVHNDEGGTLGPLIRILHGQIPYRDVFTLYGPLYLYLPAFLMMFFGKTLATLRGYFQCASMLNILAAYSVIRVLCQTRFFRYLTPLVLLLETSHPFWSSRWGGLRVGITLLALRALAKFLKHRALRQLMWAGALTGFGLLYSTDTGLLLGFTTLGCTLWISWTDRGPAPQALRRVLTAYLAGVGLVVSPCALYLASQGALGAYLSTSFWVVPFRAHAIYTFVFPSLRFAYRHTGMLLDFLGSQTAMIYLPLVCYELSLAYVLAKVVLKRISVEDGILVLLVLVGVLEYYASFRAIFGPQLQDALVPLILLLAFVSERAVGTLRDAYVRAANGNRISAGKVPACCVLLLAIVASLGLTWKPCFGTWRRWAWYQREKRTLVPGWTCDFQQVSDQDWRFLHTPRGGKSRLPRYQADDVDAVTGFLEQQTKPGERVFAYPEQGAFNFFADRPGVSKFDITGYAALSPRWRQELLQTLDAARPRFVIRGRRPSFLAREQMGLHDEALPEVGSYLDQRYRVIQQFQTVELLARRDDPAIQPADPSAH